MVPLADELNPNIECGPHTRDSQPDHPSAGRARRPQAQAKPVEIARTGETPELRIEAIRRLGKTIVYQSMSCCGLLDGDQRRDQAGLIRAYADMRIPAPAPNCWKSR